MGVKEYLKGQGYNLINDNIYCKMKEWEDLYKGYLENFHQYKIYNGTNTVFRKRATMNAAKIGCELWSNLLWNDDCYITVDSSDIEKSFSKRIIKKFKRDNDNNAQILINVVLEHCNFYSKFQESIEKSFATGAGALVAHDNTIDFIDYNMIFPLSYANGKIESCAFGSIFSHIEYGLCMYLMIHLKQADGTYIIQNKFFKIKDDQESFVEFNHQEFKSMKVKEEYTTKVKRFTIIKPNIADNIFKNNPLGISVFANSIDILKIIDLSVDGIKSSLEIGRPRIAVGANAVKTVTDNKNGQQVQIPTFDSSDTCFYQLEENFNEGTIIKDITTEYRAGNFEESLQNSLMLFAQSIGLGEKSFKWDNSGIKTATEVISENSSMFQTMRKHQQIIKDCMIDICRAILDMNNKDCDVNINVELDDSIIIDKESERVRWQQLYRDYVIPKWLYLVEYEGYSEEEAKKIVAEASENNTSNINDLFGEGGNNVI